MFLWYAFQLLAFLAFIVPYSGRSISNETRTFQNMEDK